MLDDDDRNAQTPPQSWRDLVRFRLRHGGLVLRDAVIGKFWCGRAIRPHLAVLIASSTARTGTLFLCGVPCARCSKRVFRISAFLFFVAVLVR